MANPPLKFRPAYEDYLAVTKAATFNKATLVLIALMAVVSIATVIALITGWVSIESDRLMLYLLPPGAFVLFLLYTPIHLQRSARQSAEEAQEITWRAGSRGITIGEGEKTARHTWDAFGFMQELPEHFILFFKANRSTYIFIPKRAFESAEQEAEFRALVSAQMGAIK